MLVALLIVGFHSYQYRHLIQHCTGTATEHQHQYLIYLRRSPVGVSTIRKIYGIRKSNGSKPSHWIRGAGGLARKALQVRQALQDLNQIYF